MSDLFIKTVLGPHFVKLRVAQDFEWRKDTIENPSWLDERRSPRMRTACLIWCLLDGPHKGLTCVRDVYDLITKENHADLTRALNETWELANPKAGSKNDNGSTNAQPPTSS